MIREGRFFRGYHDHYCFLPLYVFCGERLLVSYLRPSRIDGARHGWAVLALLVGRLREAWPGVRITVRGDSGFCRWRMPRWFDRRGVDYVIGVARNARLFGEVRYGARTWDAARPRAAAPRSAAVASSSSGRASSQAETVGNGMVSGFGVE